MSYLQGILGGAGIVGVIIYFMVIGFFFAATITGIIAGFGAAWWVGLLCFIPPLGLINGVVYIGTWGGTNLAVKAVAWIVASACGVPLPLC